MIVRNEEKRLAAAIESAKDAVDEIVVVDTGSMDRTVEIAESLGARIVRHRWGDDFSAARNFALDNATSDWVLQLDADEELETEDLSQIRDAIQHEALDAVFVAIHNYERDANGERRTVIHAYPRLFRRKPEIRYQGLIHEFLTNLVATTFSGIRIYHYGYDCPVQEQQKLRGRNETICQRQLDKNPGNPIAHFNMAGVQLSEQRIDEARKHLEQAIQLINPQDGRYQHFYLMALHYLAGICGAKGEIDQAVRYCHEAIRTRSDYLDPLFMLGELQFRQGQDQDAEATYLGFLELRERLVRRPTQSLLSQSRLNSHDHVHLRLGTLYQGRGDLIRAEQHYQQAVGANPHSLGANLQLARLYTQKQEVTKAKQYLAAARRLQETASVGN